MGYSAKAHPVSGALLTLSADKTNSFFLEIKDIFKLPAS